MNQRDPAPVSYRVLGDDMVTGETREVFIVAGSESEARNLAARMGINSRLCETPDENGVFVAARSSARSRGRTKEYDLFRRRPIYTLAAGIFLGHLALLALGLVVWLAVTLVVWLTVGFDWPG